MCHPGTSTVTVALLCLATNVKLFKPFGQFLILAKSIYLSGAPHPGRLSEMYKQTSYPSGSRISN